MIAYKLFRIKNGTLYPLYVLSDKPTKIGEWVNAEAGELQSNGKVKAKLGDGLAYRPGWHCANLPLATHIGKKQSDGTLAQRTNNVWAEVEVADEIDYQYEANANGTNKKGVIVPVKACLKHIPTNGYYRYKTNPNMFENWIITGAIKVNRILSNDEVAQICISAGYTPQKLAV